MQKCINTQNTKLICTPNRSYTAVSIIIIKAKKMICLLSQFHDTAPINSTPWLAADKIHALAASFTILNYYVRT